MKTKNIYAWMAAAMTLAACSTNDIADSIGNDGDNVVNVASATRTATASGNASADITTFHLVNTTQRDKYQTKFGADYILDGNAYAIKNGKVVWYNESDAPAEGNTFEAFTPLTTGANLASFSSFVIPTYQASQELLQSADWMTATTTKKKDEATDGLDLTFSHRNAKLHFDVYAKDDAIAMQSEDFNVIGSITPYYNNSSTTTTIEAIVVPRETAYTTNDELINIMLGNETFSLSFPSEITFEEGKQYNFTLNLGHDAVAISSVSVSDWEDESVSSDEDEAWIRFDDSNIEYITFTADSEQGFKFYDTLYGSTLSGFEYSVNNEDWIAIPSEGITEAIPFGGEKGDLRLRGKNLNGTATGGNDTDAKRIYFTNAVSVACTGDIRTLLDYEHYTTVPTVAARFSHLFRDCTQLTSAPKLPATDLNDHCYQAMFSGCTSLITAPELPATNLRSYCYQSMFQGCTSLTTAPELKATTLKDQCYFLMFNGCTNLNSVTMLATDVSAFECLASWLKDAGTGAQSRTLKLKNEAVYNTIKDKTSFLYNTPILPDLWKSGATGTMVTYEDNNP